MDLGLREEPPETAAKNAKELNATRGRKSLTIFTLFVGFLVSFAMADVEAHSIDAWLIGKLASSLPGVVLIGVFAGIPAGILWNRNSKFWFQTFLIIAWFIIFAQFLGPIYSLY